MKIALGCDHIVTDVKMKISKHLKEQGHEIIDVGTYDFVRTHYPIYGRLIAEEVVNGRADFGVALCGTGVGIAVSADKVPGTRVVLVGDVATARSAREELIAKIDKLSEVSPDVAANDHIFDEEYAKWNRGEYHD